jgi:hypothetical protein
MVPETALPSAGAEATPGGERPDRSGAALVAPVPDAAASR